MCTSLYVKVRDGDEEYHLFGRNMDIEAHFGERVVISPRSYPFIFRCLPQMKRHYAMIGTATVVNGYPLYADAMNEKGLCMAGLHFPGNALYAPPCGYTQENFRIAPFELIPYLLGRCATVAEVRGALSEVTVSDIHFSADIVNTPLHWHIGADDGSLIVEVTAQGIQIYDDVHGVLTNNPPYPYHIAHMHRFDGLTATIPSDSKFRRERMPMGDTYDLGLGMVGLPGDYSSPARFARCAVLRKFTDWSVTGEEAVARFMSVLGAVAPPEGCVINLKDETHSTRYRCCMDAHMLTYHVMTENKIAPLSVVLTEARCEGETLSEAHP